MGSKDATLKWRQPSPQGQGMEDHEQEIPKLVALSLDISIKAPQQPGAVQFTAYEKGTTNILKMNDQDSLTITPLLNPTTTTVMISEGKVSNNH